MMKLHQGGSAINGATPSSFLDIALCFFLLLQKMPNLFENTLNLSKDWYLFLFFLTQWISLWIVAVYRLCLNSILGISVFNTFIVPEGCVLVLTLYGPYVAMPNILVWDTHNNAPHHTEWGQKQWQGCEWILWDVVLKGQQKLQK